MRWRRSLRELRKRIQRREGSPDAGRETAPPLEVWKHTNRLRLLTLRSLVLASVILDLASLAVLREGCK
ncbi:MAG: hypothetical protein ACYS8K_10380, partial [Planctomycetota bacterium]